MTQHILIIGAGIIGTALADRLAPHTRVTIIDSHQPGQGTTATSLAWLNANKTLDPDYFAFRQDALAEWARLAAELGHPSWYVPAGNMTWAQTDTTRTELAQRVERLRARGYAARLITPSEARAIEPALTIPAGALIAHFPEEGFIHGTQAIQALMDRAHNAGAQLITQDPVANLLRHGDRVTGVRLESGADIAADVTVCAAGWRTPEILATADLTIPLLDVHAPGSAAPCLVAATTPASGVLRGLIHAPGVYARPAWDGGLLLEASDLDAKIDMNTPMPTLQSQAEEFLDRARSIIPALTQAHIAQARRCIRPMPLDGLPLIGWHLPRLYVAATHSGITSPHTLPNSPPVGSRPVATSTSSLPTGPTGPYIAPSQVRRWKLHETLST
ncbi:NAD(P)/FAD-dependent oxidoreductase [Actinomadura rudentiformis]|nr:FAD-dependent oxidoreductase [Actinomadura rudentiformis]